MLRDVIPYLICPVCGSETTLAGESVRCAGGHVFDVARQGYVNLRGPERGAGTGDTAPMVAAREGFLNAGHYAPLAEALTAGLPEHGLIVDAGAGTGYYLSAVLRDRPGRIGLAVDSSKYALRRAARAHERIGAVVADVWRPLPVRTASAAAVLNVFAPRNGAEFHRVLQPSGVLVVVTPTPRHLRGLVETLGLLTVDEHKETRVGDTLAGHFTSAGAKTLEVPLKLGREEVTAIVAMGPSAWHTDPAVLAERIKALPGTVEETASFQITCFHPIP
ncbi:putative RNA methyltransferase [Rhizohabitans arisaemae]|uniref:putative RNA methyltransferase n=1 Tax=Rhizohabitans arisaemae TaxID=2720610 RepID=UPI0024B12B16|nr:methyltransferase domain-containing protein [Rhizohabitans arisaemae]